MKTTWMGTAAGLVSSCCAWVWAGCDETYSTYLQNRSTQIGASTTRNEFYMTHCEKNGDVRRESSDASLAAGLGKISGSFGKKESSIREQAQEFCKQQYTLRSSSEQYYSREEMANVRMGLAYNQCKTAEASGLQVQDTTLTGEVQRSAALTFSFPAGRTVFIQGVSFGPTGSCELRGIEKNPIKLKAPSDGRKFEAKGPFSVACERGSLRDKDGREEKRGGEWAYDPLELQATVDGKTYSMTMPAEGRGDYDRVRSLKAQIDAAEGKAKAAEARIKELESRKVTMITAIKSDSNALGEAWQRISCTGDPMPVIKARCDGGQIFGPPAIFSVPHGGCGANYITYACLK